MVAAVAMVPPFGGTATQSVAEDPLSAVPFEIGSDGLFSEPRSGGRQGPLGRWVLEGGRLADGRLRLRISIEPTAHGLPVRSGPAVLFAGIEAFGGWGDVAIGERLDVLVTVPLPACDDANCRYVADIDLPTDGIPGAIERVLAVGHLSGVGAQVTLVRSFGGGSWLQVLPLNVPELPGGGAGAAGRLGAIEGVEGIIFPYGLFPADQATVLTRDNWAWSADVDYGAVVDRLRQQAGDPTQPMPTVPGRVRVEIGDACVDAARLSMHNDAGDQVFGADVAPGRLIQTSVRFPIGVAWRLTLHDGGGIDLDQRQGWGERTDEIEADGSPITIDARFSCIADPTVRVDKVLAAPLRSPDAGSSAPAPAGMGSPDGLVSSASVIIVGVAATLALGGLLGPILLRRLRRGGRR